jgi:hypothetical protein
MTMERYEVEYRHYFVEISVRESLGRPGPSEYAAEVRITAQSYDCSNRTWISLDRLGPPGFRSESRALEEGLNQGMAYIDSMLVGKRA